MSTFIQDQDRVAKFYKNNDQKIKKILGELSINIEYETDQICKILDKYSNIDFISIKNGCVYGISARVNFAQHTQKHLTIRYKRKNGTKTEYEKALQVYKRMQDYPLISSYHIRMDSNEDMIMQRAIIVNKKQLIETIESNKEYFENNYMNTVKGDGNSYFKIPFAYFALNKKIDFKHYE